MKAVRRFLVAPSLARLVRKERGSAAVTEGYFATQSGRNSHVLLEGGQYQLVLVSAGPGGAVEERTDVPRAHADALLDVCAGQVVYERASVAIGGGREALIDRFAQPGQLDLISVEFANSGEAQAFAPPLWFGEDVTDDEAYDRRRIALSGVPAARGVPALSDAALDALLDALEGRPSATRVSMPTGAEPGVLDALRRLSTASAEAPSAPAAPALEEPAPALQEPSAPAEIEPFPSWRSPAAPVPGPVAASSTLSATGDESRIDDVIAGLSQVLGASSTEPAPDGGDRRAAAVVEVDRWVGRIRRQEA